jgi:DNA-binding response OmpR family regulator
VAIQILVADDRIDEEGYDVHELPALLRAAGYEVIATADGEQVYDLVEEQRPDLVVLDICFSDQQVSGLDIIEAIMLNPDPMPVILITGQMTETEAVVRGFQLGADDYVTLPRDNREILARIRRSLPPEVLIIDDHIAVDRAARTVCIKEDGGWTEVHLQPLQYELLDALIIHAEQTVVSVSLKERVWGRLVSDSILAVYVHRLRCKLEPDPANPVYIETVRGIGYRFRGRPVRVGTMPKCRRRRYLGGE